MQNCKKGVFYEVKEKDYNYRNCIMDDCIYSNGRQGQALPKRHMPLPPFDTPNTPFEVPLA